jgi:alanyl-tRNA synthetase
VLVKRVCEVLGGSGGKAGIAQGGGTTIEKVKEAMEEGVKLIEDLLNKS